MKRNGVDASNDLAVRSALLPALLCCNTTLEKVKDPDSGEMKWEPKGNSSEAPIVVAARKVGFAEDLAKAYKRVLEIPFSSSRKMMLTVSDVSGRATLCREAWLCLRAKAPQRLQGRSQFHPRAMCRAAHCRWLARQ